MKILHLFCRQTGTRPIHVTIPKRYVYFWEISSFLSKQKKYHIESIDCLDPQNSIFNLTKKIIATKPDMLVCLIRIENVFQTIKFANFIKTINPKLSIIVYGDIVNKIPVFFRSIDSFDATVESGDWELSLLSYIRHLENKKNKIKGVYTKHSEKVETGEYLDNDWSFVDIKKMPYNFYGSLDRKRQMTLTVARGCPYNCKYCLSVCTFGYKDRRKKVDDVIRFLKKNKKNCDSFKLFAPTFNADSAWVEEFCNKVIKRKIKISWCATSRIDLLDDENLIKLMKQSGCYKISVGLETINKSSRYLNKEFSKDQIIKVARLFKKYRIVLKGLVMIGVPHQTKNDIIELFDLMKKNNITIRPTSYSPLNELNKDKLSVDELQRYDKFTFYKYGIKGATKSQYFQLLVDPENYKKILR